MSARPLPDIAAALRFALKHVFDAPRGWYPASVFPDEPGTVEEQIAAGRDSGSAFAARAREMLRAALPAAEALPELVEALEAYHNHFGDLEDNMMLHPSARRCMKLARAALAKARAA